MAIEPSLSVAVATRMNRDMLENSMSMPVRNLIYEFGCGWNRYQPSDDMVLIQVDGRTGKAHRSGSIPGTKWGAEVQLRRFGPAGP